MSKNMQAEINSRLKMIFNMIPKCNKLGDVGTDHGLLPIYSVEQGRCCLAVASDLREGPLSIAKKNIKLSGMENLIETLLCPGLEGYFDKDCDVIVIAGMGGLTICKILEDWLNLCKMKNYFPGNICFLLQPNTHEPEVRKFLWDHGFKIEDEQATQDANHIYLAIKGSFGHSLEEYNSIDCYLGKIMINRLSENDFVYFKGLKTKYNNIVLGLNKKNSLSDDIVERKSFCMKLISILESVLEEGVNYNGTIKG